MPRDISHNMMVPFPMAEATAYANDIAEKENDDGLAEMKKSGKTEFYNLTDAEKKAWKAKLQVVHKDLSSRVGKDLIESIYKATGQE